MALQGQRLEAPVPPHCPPPVLPHCPSPLQDAPPSGGDYHARHLRFGRRRTGTGRYANQWDEGPHSQLDHDEREMPNGGKGVTQGMVSALGVNPSPQLHGRSRHRVGHIMGHLQHSLAHTHMRGVNTYRRLKGSLGGIKRQMRPGQRLHFEHCCHKALPPSLLRGALSPSPAPMGGIPGP